MNATKGSSNEMLSVPYQQIANVYYYEKDSLDEITVSEIKEIIPDVEYYVPELSDPVKTTGMASSNKSTFFKLYLKQNAFPNIW